MAYLADGNLFAAKQDLTIASLNMPSDPDIPRALSAIASQSQAAPIPFPPQPSPSQSKIKASSGSAFRIANGQFVTNHHVINGCNWLTVDGKLGGRLLASDQTRDLALVSVANDSGPIASIRTSRIQLNESITAAGFPLEGAFSGIAITNGTISRLSGLRGDTGEVQISAPVQPGKSGGPLRDTAEAVSLRYRCSVPPSPRHHAFCFDLARFPFLFFGMVVAGEVGFLQRRN
jgi:S1-C subfamily serine protease